VKSLLRGVKPMAFRVPPGSTCYATRYRLFTSMTKR